MNSGNRPFRLAGTLALAFAFIAASFMMSATAGHAATPVTVGGKALVTNTDGDNIRVRKGAGASFSQVAEAHEGETVAVLAGPSVDAKGKEWYRIEGPAGTGWIASEFLEGKSAPASPAKEQPSKSAAKPGIKSAPKLSGFAVVSNTDGDPLRVRSAADREGKVVKTLAPDISVAVKAGPVTDTEGIVWYQISAEGVTGWAMAEYLAQAKAPAASATPPPTKPVAEAKPAVAKAPAPVQPAVKPAVEKAAPKAVPVVEKATSANPKAEEAVRSGSSRGEEPQDSAGAGAAASGQRVADIAMRYVGYRYVRGGTSPRGFDCSGFINYVYNTAGISMSRDMGTQLRSGPRVSTKNLMPGDLLFWSNTYKPGLSHAGVYIGNGKFVHAENEGTGVRISAMSNPYYSSRFTAAVRPR